MALTMMSPSTDDGAVGGVFLSQQQTARPPATVPANIHCFDYVVDGLRDCFDNLVDGVRHCVL